MISLPFSWRAWRVSGALRAFSEAPTQAPRAALLRAACGAFFMRSYGNFPFKIAAMMHGKLPISVIAAQGTHALVDRDEPRGVSKVVAR